MVKMCKLCHVVIDYFCSRELAGTGEYTSAVAGVEGIAEFSAAISRELRDRVRHLLSMLSRGEVEANKENRDPEAERDE